MERDLRARKGITLGIGTNESKSIKVDTGNITNPELRFNTDRNEWEYSNNGVDFMALGGDKGVSGLPPSIVYNIFRTQVGDTLYLCWADPGDTYIENQMICTWKGTKVVMKEGSEPESVEDGVEVLDNQILNKYEASPLEITGLDVSKQYYIRFFPYSTKKVTNDSTLNIASKDEVPTTYTVTIDTTNPDPESALVYRNGSLIPLKSGTDWDTIFGYYPVILKNGVETVKLNPNDYTKDIEGNTVNLADPNVGDVMVAFPRRGIKIETKGDILTVQLTTEDNKKGFSYNAHTKGSALKSKFYYGAYKGFEDNAKLRSWSGKSPTASKTIGAFRTLAQANGTGYEQSGFYQITYLQVLYILKYKNLNSQEAVGRGFVDGNSSSAITGGTDTKGLNFGETTGKQQMKLFGIEDFWGNVYEWVDGIVTSGNGNILTATTNFEDAGSGYLDTGNRVEGTIDSYLTKVQGNNTCGFVIKTGGGNDNTYFCDYGYLQASRVARFGGAWSFASIAGAFCLQLSHEASSSASSLSARLMFL